MAVKVLFVCLGNIYRSPMAEAIFADMVDKEGLDNKFEIDSAGTSSWHIGESAHRGTLQVLYEHGIKYYGLARQVRKKEMADHSTFVIAMDSDNILDLERRFGPRPKMSRILDYAENTDLRDVPDPYYEGNFEDVYQMIADGCRGLLETIKKEKRF